jgi:hypothetical protein
MTEREMVEALTILVGSRRKARGLLARAIIRHLANAPVEELERLMPPMIARRFHAAPGLAKNALTPERPVSIKVRSAAYAHVYPFFAGREDLLEAGELLGIRVIDHLVVAGNTYRIVEGLVGERAFSNGHKLDPFDAGEAVGRGLVQLIALIVGGGRALRGKGGGVDPVDPVKPVDPKPADPKPADPKPADPNLPPGYDPTARSFAELQGDRNPALRPGETPAQARRARAAEDEILRRAPDTIDALGKSPRRVNPRTDGPDQDRSCTQRRGQRRQRRGRGLRQLRYCRRPQPGVYGVQQRLRASRVRIEDLQ